jgi:mRNA-degrading endonuclease RelE of RelBE toxin-antitoxin system
MSLAGKFTVALSSDFLGALSRVPKDQQNKVREFVRKFREDPTQPSINYEKIAQFKDPNMRSVRIDQAYRGIILRPKDGNTFVLLWVANHDDAYDWAKRKICSIHPETGSLQILNTEELTAQAEVPAAETVAGLFAEYRDRNLTGLGVPEVLLPLVRSLATEKDLDRVSAYLPQEVSEALYMLAAGFGLDEVHREMERPAEPIQVDTTDFTAALSNRDSLRRFAVVENEDALLDMLDAPLEQWRVFLHPSQRKLVQNTWNGPARVLGGAGTGKTVVAMHRARWLATNVFTGEHDRVLFTTFTRNLAADIRENLKKLCSDEAMRRIEVVNLDRWVSEFLKKQGYSNKVVYGHKTQEFWGRAMALAPSEPVLPPSFYREEWDAVVQPQSVASLQAYMKASRLGRGVRLNRAQRKQVWPVFEEYRLLLQGKGLIEGVDAIRDARGILESKGNILPYKAIVVDEAQDMGMQAFQLIRAMLPADEEKPNIFIVGDAHQRIYRHKVVLSKCGINIRGRSRRLRINYRTTDETRRWAVSLLEGIKVDDLDGGEDSSRGYKALLRGPEPVIKNFATFQKEVDGIVAYLRSHEGGEEALASTCLVTRTNEALDQYEAGLTAAGIACYRVKRTEADDRQAKGVRLATMHRVKGLEFDRMIIAQVNQGIVPLAVAKNTQDPTVARSHEVHERSLLYVAATRAKKEVLVTSFGERSEFLS